MASPPLGISGTNLVVSEGGLAVVVPSLSALERRLQRRCGPDICDIRISSQDCSRVYASMLKHVLG